MTQFSKWKIIGYAAAIFVAGGISGGALGIYQARSNLLSPPREQEMAVHLLNRFQARLELTPDQVANIKPIIDSAAADLNSIRADSAKRVNQVFDDSYTKVSAILTPDQRIKLDQMKREHHERMQRAQGPWRSHHPGPGDSREERPESRESPLPVTSST